ncbi:recombinase family protein [Psychrobacter immobilis]|uniref:recombinase family protein n=1 Tax=Psychrobacter immobilis TaxID=498 RepID=UPI003FD62ED1
MVTLGLDTTTSAGRAFLQIQAAFAEMERNIIRQRVKEEFVRSLEIFRVVRCIIM